MWPLVLLVACAAVAYFVAMRKPPTSPPIPDRSDLLPVMLGNKKQSPPPAPQNDSVAAIRGDGSFEFPVVGESRYQAALEDICGGRSEEGVEHECDAMLVLEDDNRHDAQAVRVDIEGQAVGYLDREAARSFRARISETQAAHFQSFRCRALIVGGWDRGEDDRGHFGVRLDIPLEP